ncbi:MAG TPA: MarR family winged helix-turn-helix transcriptional regulator [Terriglobales bacterium]|nr:MarR family winged helix-turn-helix transcriptional regulator [Terriglobales bacterium]
MIVSKPVPQDILQDSVLAHIAAAYFAVGRRLERKTGCSATRGFILNALRDGAALNQNQVATALGLDRTVVHRAIRSMVREGLLSERKAASGRAIDLKLTAKGNRYHERLIQQRRAADEKLRKALPPADRESLVRVLRLIAELEL